MKKIIMIGPFPPPVHGMAKNLQIVKEQLAGETVICLDISPGGLKRNFVYHFTKFYKVCFTLTRFFYLLVTKQVRSIYMPPDAGLGLYYSFIFIRIALLFRQRVVLHHRSFAYIHTKNFLMDKIAFLSEGLITHIFLCNCMRERFEGVYGTIQQALIVSNAQHVEIKKSAKDINDTNESVTIGFLSNLSEHKGLYIFLQLIESLFSKGVKIRVLLAGPPDCDEVEHFINDYLKNGHLPIEYLGPIYGAQKSQFFDQLDFFVFPTKYKNEAQPNVVFEAMAGGSCVVSSNLACLSEDVNDELGFSAELDDDWVKNASSYVVKMASNRETLSEQKARVLTHIERLRNEAREQNQLLIDRVVNGQ